MGGIEKGLIEVGGQTLLDYVIATIQPQVDELLLNANRALERYQRFALPIISDDVADLGPLGGIASGLHHSRHPLLLVVPCDCPRLPRDLVTKLYQAMQQQQRPLAVAHDGQWLQPLACLIRRELLPSLEASLAAGELKVQHWLRQQSPAIAEFDDADAFANINTPEQLTQLAGADASE